MGRVGLRHEAKSALRGTGPPAGPMLRSQSPARGAALAAVPARKGRRAGQPCSPAISFTAARRAVLAAVRHGTILSYTALTSAIATCRIVIDRNRHRARKAKCPSTFGHASLADTATRIAGAVITLANQPA
ncbi:MAG: hypothetical protein ACRDNT_04855 [Streptosporangiaceae bacterium]